MLYVFNLVQKECFYKKKRIDSIGTDKAIYVATENTDNINCLYQSNLSISLK